MCGRGGKDVGEQTGGEKEPVPLSWRWKGAEREKVKRSGQAHSYNRYLYQKDAIARGGLKKKKKKKKRGSTLRSPRRSR